MMNTERRQEPRSCRSLRHPGSVVLLAPLLWRAPAALAFAPTPSGGFVGDTGSNDEVAQQNRVDDFRSGLQLGLRAQEASDRGDYKEAEVLYERALLLYERAPGPEDLRLVGSLANFADVYRALGKFDRAEVLYARVAFPWKRRWALRMSPWARLSPTRPRRWSVRGDMVGRTLPISVRS
jgi:tetratricopeptide (TPR) repeat protein